MFYFWLCPTYGFFRHHGPQDCNSYFGEDPITVEGAYSSGLLHSSVSAKRMKCWDLARASADQIKFRLVGVELFGSNLSVFRSACCVVCPAAISAISQPQHFPKNRRSVHRAQLCLTEVAIFPKNGLASYLLWDKVIRFLFRYWQDWCTRPIYAITMGTINIGKL